MMRKLSVALTVGSRYHLFGENAFCCYGKVKGDEQSSQKLLTLDRPKSNNIEKAVNQVSLALQVNQWSEMALSQLCLAI